jgi:hypothetical protein
VAAGALPDNTVAYTAAGVKLYLADDRIGVHGWPEPA